MCVCIRGESSREFCRKFIARGYTAHIPYYCTWLHRAYTLLHVVTPRIYVIIARGYTAHIRYYCTWLHRAYNLCSCTKFVGGIVHPQWYIYYISHLLRWKLLPCGNVASWWLRHVAKTKEHIWQKINLRCHASRINLKSRNYFYFRSHLRHNVYIITAIKSIEYM